MTRGFVVVGRGRRLENLEATWSSCIEKGRRTVAENSALVERLQITQEVNCDIICTETGVRAHLYPLYPRTFWMHHRVLDLTERELRRILEAVQRAKEPEP